MSRTSVSIGVALCGLALAGCGGGMARTAPFAQDWQSDGGKGIALVQAKLADVRMPATGGLVVGVTKTGLVASMLDGSHAWKHDGAVDARPSIAGNVVAYSNAGKLYALDGTTGKQLWAISIGSKRLRGAGDDGSITVASLGSEAGGGTLLVAVNRSGTVVRSWSPRPDVGIPAIEGGVVFAPWGGQYVSALDIAAGGEEGRVLARTVVSRALAIGGSLYFGQNALLRFDSAISKSGENGGNIVRLPERELPGKPVWFPDGTQVLPPTAGAPDAIRLYARPAETGGKLGADSERFAATYFRIAVGFDSVDGSLRWVRTMPAEVVGGDGLTGGYAFCDNEGNVWFTDARVGGAAGHVSLGTPLIGCVVDGGSFHLPPNTGEGTLAEQISAAINLSEPQMATIQRFLLRELGTNTDPTITKTLLDLATDARTQPDLLNEARSQLASRRNGIEYMLEALGRHYDYLAGDLRPPPVGPLADALAASGEKKAAPLLAAHLNDPADSTSDARHAAHALVKLATPAELPAVEHFFAEYHAAATNDDLVAAVIDAAGILVHDGGPSGAERVKRAASDPLTTAAVREGIANLLPPKPSN